MFDQRKFSLHAKNGKWNFRSISKNDQTSGRKKKSDWWNVCKVDSPITVRKSSAQGAVNSLEESKPNELLDNANAVTKTMSEERHASQRLL
jgi:hypothetical protein